ncbi:hypothetical protein CIL03_10030 [Virgibacillus indicus]|uniref:Uncharacterized protein n=1 Tax=Virgibacillus indicus TaxID=2024554 RepID=A0A265NBG3_9BACI|nr:hypothetical protein [Virgibacillus indicus]OZU88626.1 hypothetical protein CIL03_10030 [Virgibacillus indicus]
MKKISSVILLSLFLFNYIFSYVGLTGEQIKLENQFIVANEEEPDPFDNEEEPEQFGIDNFFI